MKWLAVITLAVSYLYNYNLIKWITKCRCDYSVSSCCISVKQPAIPTPAPGKPAQVHPWPRLAEEDWGEALPLPGSPDTAVLAGPVQWLLCVQPEPPTAFGASWKLPFPGSLWHVLLCVRPPYGLFLFPARFNYWDPSVCTLSSWPALSAQGLLHARAEVHSFPFDLAILLSTPMLFTGALSVWGCPSSTCCQDRVCHHHRSVRRLTQQLSKVTRCSPSWQPQPHLLIHPPC